MNSHPKSAWRAFSQRGINARDFAYKREQGARSLRPRAMPHRRRLTYAQPVQELRPTRRQGSFPADKDGWLSLADVRPNLHLRSTTTGRTGSGTRLSSCSAPEPVDPDSLERVRLPRQAGLCSHPDDVPDTGASLDITLQASWTTTTRARLLFILVIHPCLRKLRRC